MVTCASKYIKFIDIGVPEREESEKGIEKNMWIIVENLTSLMKNNSISKKFNEAQV